MDIQVTMPEKDHAERAMDRLKLEVDVLLRNGNISDGDAEHILDIANRRGAYTIEIEKRFEHTGVHVRITHTIL
jgi:hypothetical protein